MPPAPFIQQHATPKISLSVKILINKFEKVCKLFEQATNILQIAHFLNPLTPDPGCDLPSRGVQKGAPFGPRLQNDPFWSHVTPDPGCDLPSRGVPKRGPQKCYAFGGPRFWTRFAQILVQFASKHGPRSKIHFLDHVTRFPGYDLPYSLVLFQPFFIWGHFLDTFGW